MKQSKTKNVFICLLVLLVVVKSSELKADDSLTMNDDIISRERRSVSDNPRQNCGKWSPWVNNHHPSDTDKDDKEFIPKSDLDNFCPHAYGGSVTRIMCNDERGEPFEGNITDTRIGGYAITCENPYIGAICKKLNSGHVNLCPDLSMQYYCSCSNKTLQSTVQSTTESTTTNKVTSDVPVTHTADPKSTTTMSPRKDNPQTTTMNPTKDNPKTTTMNPTKDNIKTTTMSPTKDNIKTTTMNPTKDNIKTTTMSPRKDNPQTTTMNPMKDNPPTTTADSRKDKVVIAKDLGTMREDVMYTSNGLLISWWIIIIIVTVVLFIISLCVTICLYQRLKNKILERAESTKVHPLSNV